MKNKLNIPKILFPFVVFVYGFFGWAGPLGLIISYGLTGLAISLYYLVN